MKGALLQLIGTGVILGLMAGAVVIHHLHISGAKDLGEGRAAAAMAVAGPLQKVSAEVIRTEPRQILPGAGVAEAVGRAPSKTEEATLMAMHEIVGVLRSLQAENGALRTQTRALRDQLAESNRDISELQFRVDTHSESFRPLRAPSSFPGGGDFSDLQFRIDGSSGGFLPPDGASGMSGAQLLLGEKQ